MTAARSYTGDAEVDRLLFRWGAVVRDAEGWARGFALSIREGAQAARLDALCQAAGLDAAHGGRAALIPRRR